MKLLAFYWGLMFLCYIIANKLRNHAGLFAWTGKASNIVIFLIVFLMGLRMGANREVISSLGTIGVQSVIISVFTIAGTMVAVALARKVLRLDRHARKIVKGAADNVSDTEETSRDTDKNSGTSNVKFSLLILILVALGMFCGYAVIPMLFEDLNDFQVMSDPWLTAGIAVMLGIIGLSLGVEGKIAGYFKNAGIGVIIIPFAAIAGSFLSAALYSIFSPLNAWEAMACSAGFGWYTFAPGVIINAGHDVAGAVCFLHNVIRETVGLVGIPVIAAKIGDLEAATTPGVAAMDVCLPILERSASEESLVYSFCTGLFMALAVTIFTPFFIGLA